MNCPCENCIVKVMCRDRSIEVLINHCQLVRKFSGFKFKKIPYPTAEVYYNRDNYTWKNLDEVYRVLNPSRWSVSTHYGK